MTDYQATFNAIVADPRYQAALEWETAAYGGQAMTTGAYLLELDLSLELLKPKLSNVEYWKLKILMHTHDSFKREAAAGVAPTHPRSHASLAAQFLREKCDDEDLLAMVQRHDESFVLYRQFEAKGTCDPERLASLLRSIRDWSLFIAFYLVVATTCDRSRDHLKWLLQTIDGKVISRFTVADVMTRTIGSWPVALLPWRQEVIELSDREALAVFRRTDDCLNDWGYGLDASQFASVEILSIARDHNEVTDWLAERIGDGELVVVLGRDWAFRMSPRVLLNVWEDLFDFYEAVISPVSDDWVMCYWHAEVFEFARFD